MVSASQPYRIPYALRDLVLVDLLELTGNTTAAGLLLEMSQPSVSRRYRNLARDLGLSCNRHRGPGRRYSDAAWMRHLRRGVNHHRLERGVLRLGGAMELEPLLQAQPWVEWISLPESQLSHAPTLLEEELLDGVVLSQRDSGLVPCPPDAVPGSVISLGQAGGLTLRLLCRPDPLVLTAVNRLKGLLIPG